MAPITSVEWESPTPKYPLGRLCDVRYRKKLTLRGFVVVKEILVEELYCTGFEMESYLVWRKAEENSALSRS